MQYQAGEVMTDMMTRNMHYYLLLICDMRPGMRWTGFGHMLLTFNQIICKNFSTSQSLIHNDAVHGSARALRLQML